jgi:hypothetical protein
MCYVCEDQMCQNIAQVVQVDQWCLALQ